MKINKVSLKNFRCFSDLSIDLHPSLTVIVADNGQGKSTVLDAMRIGLWPFLNAIDLATAGTSDPANNISVDDVRMILTSGGLPMVRQLPAIVRFNGNYGQGEMSWERTRERETSGSKTINDDSTKKLEIFATLLQAESRDVQKERSVYFPLLAYYGTGRLWSQKKLTEKKKIGSNESANDPLIRTYGYRDCMDPSSSYRFFKDWFIWRTEIHIDEQLKKRETAPEELASFIPIQVVREATDIFLQETTGWNCLEYDRLLEKIVLNHQDNGQIPVDLLSDGIRSMLAMIGDIAYRCYQLNPALGKDAARKTKGIVLIDEIDMHLHPIWQQVIAAQLQKAFPNIQFIVTTHSPQVLSTVKPECVRVLKDGKVGYVSFSLGAKSSDLLESIQDVNPRPQKIEIVKKLNEYSVLVEKNEWDTENGKKLWEELKAWGSDHEVELRRLETDVRIREYERDIHEKSV